MKLSELIQWELRRRAGKRKPECLVAWCDRHGIHRGTVYGEHPSDRTLAMVAAALGMDVEQLKRRVG